MKWLRQLYSRHVRWWQWLLLAVIGLFFLLRAWLPGFIRQQILTQLATVTPAHVRLRDVDLNLLHGRMTLQHFSLLLDGDSQPVLTIDHLAATVHLLALLRREINIEDIRLDGIRIHAIQGANGQLNLSRLFPSSPAEPKHPPADLPTLLVQRIQITNSQGTYSDRAVTPEAHFTFAVATLQASQVALQAKGLTAPVEVQLDGTLNGGPVEGKAEVLWQRERTSIAAKVDMKHVALAVIEPYLRDALTVRRLDGQAGANIQYHYHSGPASPRHSLAGTIHINHVQFAEASSEGTVFTLPEGLITIETLDFLARNLHVQSIELKDPQLSLVQDDKGLNVASWVHTTQTDTAGFPSKKQSSSPWNFLISTIKWTGGELSYRDTTWPEQERLTLQPEEVVVNHLSGDMKELPFQFRARMGDGKVAGEGHAQLSPFGLQLSLQPTRLDIATLQPLLTRILAVKKIQGKISGTLNTDIMEQNGTRVIRAHGVVETQDFILNDTPEQGGAIRWQTGKIEIGEGSTVVPLSLHLKPELFQASLKRISKSELLIEKLNGEVQLTQTTRADGQPQRMIVGALDTTQLVLNGPPERANVLSWDSGHLEFQDGSTLVPLTLRLKTQISQLFLRQLPQGDVTVEKANSELQLAQEANAQQPSVLKVQGPVEFLNFALTQGEEKQVLLGCYHGRATIGEESRLLPLDMKLQDVAFEYPYLQGMRPASGQFQLFIPIEQKEGVSTLPSTPEESHTVTALDVTTNDAAQQPLPPSTVPTETTSPPVSIQIDRAAIIGGQLYLEDRTVMPPQTIYWQDVRVELNRVGYPILLPAAFSVHAYNEDGAPVEFKGTTERKGEQAIVRVHGKVEKMPLSRFNAYLEPSLGYRVKKGAVTATWDLTVPGDRLQANMKVSLHDIGLSGRPRSSTLEEQVGLPLTLVIALLKDLNGDINLQLPVEGRMSDPGVQWSGTVLRAVRDVLIGAVTSPLKVLGALFHGKDTLEGFTLEPIRFMAGTSQVTNEGREQLSRLALFLTQRPKIDLRLSGVTGAEDTEILRTQEMLKQLSETPSAQAQAEEPSQATPQDEVRELLTKRHTGQEDWSSLNLSPQAKVVLTQLRKRVKTSAHMTEQLANERVQAVITEMTTRHAIAADRLKMNPEKPRGAGSAEVQYTIQTREE